MDDFDNSILKHRDFETTWSTVNEVYPYLEFKRINWDSLYGVYQTKTEDARGDEYIKVIYNLLGELKDGHVSLQLLGGVNLSFKTPRQLKDENAFDLNLSVEYLDDNYELTGNNNISFATINGDIGYIYIRTFSTSVKSIDDILNYFLETKGLIIDVRHNSGGSENNANYIISHFLNNDLQTPGRYYNKEFINGHIISKKEPYYDKEVVVLTNGNCFSATEQFVMNMQHVENVFLIGDTTGGGSGYPAYFPLPSGLQIRISRVNYLQYNQTPIEWNGIVPDILIPQTEEDIKNKRDKQLERAIEYMEQ